MTRLSTLCLVFALVLGLFPACTVSTEKSPAFLKMQERLAQLEEDQKKTRKSIEDLYFEFDTVSQEIQVIKANLESAVQSPEQQIQFAGAVQRMEGLEQQLAAMQKRLETQNAAVEKAVAEAEAKARAAAKKAVASAPRPEPSRSVASSKGSAPKASSQARAAAAKPEPPKPSGFYYKVRQGDTLESVARRHEVSSAAICRANRMPMSAVLYSGQSIYIPRG